MASTSKKKKSVVPSKMYESVHRKYYAYPRFDMKTMEPVTDPNAKTRLIAACTTCKITYINPEGIFCPKCAWALYYRKAKDWVAVHSVKHGYIK